MKKYAAGILEDEHHRFYDSAKREILVGIIPKEVFYIAPSRFKIQEILWENKSTKEVMALLVDNRDVNKRYKILMEDPDYQMPKKAKDKEKLPPAFFYCFVRFKRIGANLVADLFASNYEEVEVMRLDSYASGERYFELCLDDWLEESAVYIGKAYTDFFDKSFLAGPRGQRQFILLSNYNVELQKFVSSILDSHGGIITVDVDFEADRWREQCQTLEEAYGEKLNDMYWSFLGRPVICNGGKKIRAMIVCLDHREISFEIELTEEMFNNGEKWKIKDTFFVFV